MNNRPLIIDDAVARRVRELVAWAERPENWYLPERFPEPPGDNPAYVVMIELGYLAVYTHTVLTGRHYRHLSVSVEGHDRRQRYPNPVALCTIATLFGFTGGKIVGTMTVEPGPVWQVNFDPAGTAVAVVQEIEAPKPERT